MKNEVINILIQSKGRMAPHVEKVFKNNKLKTIYCYNICDHKKCFEEVGSQAVSYTTGVPAMIGSLLMLKKTWFKPGVWNLEQFDPDPFIKLLNLHGLPNKIFTLDKPISF